MMSHEPQHNTVLHAVRVCGRIYASTMFAGTCFPLLLEAQAQSVETLNVVPHRPSLVCAVHVYHSTCVSCSIQNAPPSLLQLEVLAQSVEILNVVSRSLPFPVSEAEEQEAPKEETRLRHRVLDLRCVLACSGLPNALEAYQGRSRSRPRRGRGYDTGCWSSGVYWYAQDGPVCCRYV